MIDHSGTDNVIPPSERSFGLVFAAFFLVVALFPLTRGLPPRYWSLGISTLFGILAWLAPRSLAPLNRVWFRLGLLLHKIVNPMVMGVIYGGVIVPTGLIMRLFQKDPLRLEFDPAATSYWVKREPPGPTPASLKHLF